MLGAAPSLRFHGLQIWVTQITMTWFHWGTWTQQWDIYHVVLRFAISDHDGNAIFDLPGSVGGGEDVVHGKLDGPASLGDSQRTVRTW